MDDARMEALRGEATQLIEDLRLAVGVPGSAGVGWIHGSARPHSVASFRVDQAAGNVELNQRIVQTWFETLPASRAEARFAALALRAGASLLFSPEAYAWSEATEVHLRSRQDRGLDSTYTGAFWAANAILEGHRLDQRVIQFMPDAEELLAELVTYDLDAHPVFDVYPRGAIVIGRPSLAGELAQPAFDDFVDTFGIDEAERLTATLAEYVALTPNAVDAMVEATAQLVFLAFPDAMGLTFGDSADSDIWPVQGAVGASTGAEWVDLEELIAAALSGFSGEAGLDYGDALLIGLGGDPLAGRRFGAWSHSGGIVLDLVQTDLNWTDIKTLVAHGWEQFENSPGSFHKTSTAQPQQIASECVWIIRDLLGRPGVEGLVIWGRGAAEQAVHDLEWTLDVDTSSTPVSANVDAGEPAVSEDTAGPTMVEALADAGLVIPPLGPARLSDVETFGLWHWGTQTLSPRAMYDFEIAPVVTALIDAGPLFALSHSGHGTNSHRLNVVTAGGPFAAFVQHRFGDVCTDPLWARLAINEAYTYLHVLFAAAQLEEFESPRWLLLYSQFRGTCGIVDLDQVRTVGEWQSAYTPFRTFGALIRGAVALVPEDKTFMGFGTAIDWGEDEPEETQ